MALKAKAARRAYQERYRKEHREQLAAYFVQYHEEHERKGYKVNKEKRATRDKRYCIKNKEKIIAKKKRQREMLDDGYVKHKITGLTAADITPEMIELKRAQLIIHRALKQIGGI